MLPWTKLYTRCSVYTQIIIDGIKQSVVKRLQNIMSISERGIWKIWLLRKIPFELTLREDTLNFKGGSKGDFMLREQHK